MKNIYFLLLLLIFTSCKKEESVQTYILKAQEKPEFVTFDVSSTILQLGKHFAPAEHRETYSSIRKVNVTALPIEKTTEENYNKEKENLKNILENSDYTKLMNFKKDGKSGTLYYKGDTESIDEIIAFGYSDEIGVGIARILGEKMNPVAIKDMVENPDINLEDFDFGMIHKMFGLEIN